MDHQTPDRRMQQRCAKDVSMTCSHLNQKDERMVTIRNYNDKGLYFESDEALLVDSFIVLRAVGVHEMGNFGSRAEHPFLFSIENSDPGACRGYRSHTVARVVRCEKVNVDPTRFGVGAKSLILSE
ncbi:MAG: hypothetical protein KQI81_07610 [Deltaproteobacteria bacterium]|nr:hypothetical protein [Deltaproteobacteria bacterium]